MPADEAAAMRATERATERAAADGLGNDSDSGVEDVVGG
jgi:hypothetical protein